MAKPIKKTEILSTKKACNPNLSFIVEACAGSGKTWLICSRILRFLVEGGKPSSVLALTFTNKAAGEMQSRLNQFLFYLASEPDENVVEKLISVGIKRDDIDKILPRARSLYESILVEADQPIISTFQSWYSKILTMSPPQLGIYSSVSLAPSGKEFQNKIWKKFLGVIKKSIKGESSEFMLLVENIGLRSVKTALCSLIPIRIEIENSTKKNKYAAKNDEIKQCIKTCEYKYKLWCDENLSDSIFLFNSFKQIDDKKYFTGLLKDLNPKNLVELANCLLRKDRSSLAYRFIRKKEEKTWGEETIEIKRKTESFANSLVLMLRECEILMCKSRDKVLIDLSRIFFSCLDDYVFEKKETDYSGFEFLAWKNISGEYGPYFQSRLDFKYDQILIDEFQDTSTSQWKILRQWLSSYVISEKGVESTAPKIFVVGDPKQAIYKFRGADPRVFFNSQIWLEKNFHATKLETSKTRRCSAEIVKFMNTLFCNRDSFSYRKHHSLNKAKGGVFCLPKVKNVIDNPNKIEDRNWLTEPIGGKESDLWKIEGKQIGKFLLKIKTDLVDFAWSDIKILVKNRIHSKDISDSLSALGIPNISDSNLNVLDQQEIIDLVSLLQFLLDNTSDYDFVVVAKSSLFGLEDKELIWLKQNIEIDNADDSLWSNLNMIILKRGKLVPKKLLFLTKSLKVYKEKLEFMPVHDFLQFIISSSNLIANLKIKLDSYRFSKAISNIEKFIEFSLDVDFGKFPSLAKFLSTVSQAREHKDFEGLKVEHIDEFEAVSVQTFHSTKGLESRVVVLSGMSDFDNYDKEGIKWLLSFDSELENIDDIFTFRSGEFLEENRLQTLNYEKKLSDRENFNLLYVGVTRAKEILILSAVQQNRSKESWYDMASSCCNQYHF